MPGATKDWKSWRKTWQDLKSRTKSKAGHIKHYARGTGGGPPLEDKLSSMEEEILDCVKIVSVEGHKKATESAVDFDFHFIEDPVAVPREEIQLSEKSTLPPKAVTVLVEDNVFSGAGLPVPPDTVNKENVSLDGGLLVASTSGNKHVPKKKQAVTHTLQAVNDFKSSIEKKTANKEKYYERKLDILERIAVAKEEANNIKTRIAVALESIADTIC